MPQPGRRRRCRERGATGHLAPMCGVRLSPQLAGPYQLFGACKLVPPPQQSWVRSPQSREEGVRTRAAGDGGDTDGVVGHVEDGGP